MEKIDFKKKDKLYYQPGPKPVLVEIPEFTFIMVDGREDPNTEPYRKAVQALYSLSYTIKMSRKNNYDIHGYYDYTVPPLESLWWQSEGKIDSSTPKSGYLWTAMIRQPEFVTPEVFNRAVCICRDRKPDVDTSSVRLETFREGLCVQMMHRGSYDDESPSMKLIEEFIHKNNLTDLTGRVHKHHEIYLSNPERCEPSKLKTVLRVPVKK